MIAKTKINNGRKWHTPSCCVYGTDGWRRVERKRHINKNQVAVKINKRKSISILSRRVVVAVAVRYIRFEFHFSVLWSISDKL